jgi:hypothetical protein
MSNVTCFSVTSPPFDNSEHCNAREQPRTILSFCNEEKIGRKKKLPTLSKFEIHIVVKLPHYFFQFLILYRMKQKCRLI